MASLMLARAKILLFLFIVSLVLIVFGVLLSISIIFILIGLPLLIIGILLLIGVAIESIRQIKYGIFSIFARRKPLDSGKISKKGIRRKENAVIDVHEEDGVYRT